MAQADKTAISFVASGLAGGKKEITIDFDKNIISSLLGRSIFTRTTDPRRPEGGKSYAFIKINNKPQLLSRFLMGVIGDNTVTVDHINGEPTDNRKCNLRVCSKKNNQLNRGVGKNSKTGFKGVTYIRKKNGYKYTAQIQLDKIHTYIGTFATPEEAAYIYDQFAMQLFGEYARTNFQYDGGWQLSMDNPKLNEVGFL